MTTISKKKINSFEEQSRIFTDLILRLKKKDLIDFKDGENSLKYYEEVWKNFQNKSLK